VDVKEILNLLKGHSICNVEDIYLFPPEGDDSDGYDESDKEEGEAVLISRTILQVN
jgi:hypothetical protein